MPADLCILAPGLLGSSVARAARARGTAGRVAVWARRPETRLALEREGWCDAVFATAAEAARGAAVVVACAPVDAIPALVAEIAPALADGALVTDVGSVKGELCRLCAQAVPERAAFVGAHPMAGSEKTGHEHGNADLFVGRTCFVTPLRGAEQAPAVERCTRFWAGLGAEVVTLDPDAHDEIVAHISHLPHLLAALLCEGLARRDPSWQLHAGNGLRDMTRIAAGDPQLWRAIVAMNRHEILRAVTGFQEQLDVLRAALANGDDLAVRRILETARVWRSTLPVR